MPDSYATILVPNSERCVQCLAPPPNHLPATLTCCGGAHRSASVDAVRAQAAVSHRENSRLTEELESLTAANKAETADKETRVAALEQQLADAQAASESQQEEPAPGRTEGARDRLAALINQGDPVDIQVPSGCAAHIYSSHVRPGTVSFEGEGGDEWDTSVREATEMWRDIAFRPSIPISTAVKADCCRLSLLRRSLRRRSALSA